MYTMGSAYVTSEERVKGSLEVGKLADLIVLDRDILECPEDEIKDTQVRATLLGLTARFVPMPAASHRTCCDGIGRDEKHAARCSRRLRTAWWWLISC